MGNLDKKTSTKTKSDSKDKDDKKSDDDEPEETKDGFAPLDKWFNTTLDWKFWNHSDTRVV